jgi:hypothetical protein
MSNKYSNLFNSPKPIMRCGCKSCITSVFFLMSICFAPKFLFAQFKDSFYFDYPYLHPYVRKIPFRQTVTAEMHKRIGDFVKIESIRFKQALHPLFSKTDSFLKDSALSKIIELNPFYVLDSTLKDYVYIPYIEISNVKYDNFYRRNLFSVSLIHRFIRAESKEKKIAPDTVWLGRRDEKQSLFGSHDFMYHVYYCPKTDRIFMVGGNAFLERLEDEWMSLDSGYPHALILAMRSRHLHGADTEDLDAIGEDERSTIESVLPKRNTFESDTFFYFTTRPERGMRFDLRYPVVNYFCTPVVRLFKTEGSFTPRPYLYLPWDRLEYVRFIRADHIDGLIKEWKWAIRYEKGYSYYEVKNFVYANPTSYADIIPKIRGLSEAEVNKIKTGSSYWNLMRD